MVSGGETPWFVSCMPAAEVVVVQWRRPCGDIGRRFRLDDVLECARIAAKVRFKSEGRFRRAPDLNSSPLDSPRSSVLLGLLSRFFCSTVDNAPESIFNILNVVHQVRPLTSLEHMLNGAERPPKLPSSRSFEHTARKVHSHDHGSLALPTADCCLNCHILRSPLRVALRT